MKGNDQQINEENAIIMKTQNHSDPHKQNRIKGALQNSHKNLTLHPPAWTKISFSRLLLHPSTCIPILPNVSSASSFYWGSYFLNQKLGYLGWSRLKMGLDNWIDRPCIKHPRYMVSSHPEALLAPRGRSPGFPSSRRRPSSAKGPLFLVQTPSPGSISKLCLLSLLTLRQNF